MSPNSSCEDLISAIERLKTVHGLDENSIGMDSPIASLISPEWHYSDCFRIAEDIDIDWDGLEGSWFIQKASTDLTTIKFNCVLKEEFERSFCSWYQPYHHPPRIKWGIHIRYDSYMRVAGGFYRANIFPYDNTVNSAKAAFLYLITHHLFHHIIENAASLMEIIVGKPGIYEQYYRSVYIGGFNSSKCLEESLANRYLYEFADYCHIDRRYLKEELMAQSDGYRDFARYMNSDFLEAKRHLISQIKYATFDPPRNEPLEQIVDNLKPNDYVRRRGVPLWLHYSPKPLHQRMY